MAVMVGGGGGCRVWYDRADGGAHRVSGLSHGGQHGGHPHHGAGQNGAQGNGANEVRESHWSKTFLCYSPTASEPDYAG